jgi:hypothetical protein
VSVLRQLTAPPVERAWGPWRRIFTVTWPIPLGILILLNSNGFEALAEQLPVGSAGSMPSWSVVVLLGGLLSLALLVATWRGPPSSLLFRGVLDLVALVAAIVSAVGGTGMLAVWFLF